MSAPPPYTAGYPPPQDKPPPAPYPPSTPYPPQQTSVTTIYCPSIVYLTNCVYSQMQTANTVVVQQAPVTQFVKVNKTRILYSRNLLRE